MNRLKKGDEVIILAGKDKGKKGTVATFFDNDRVLVEGVNLVKKHTKANPMTGAQGGIVNKEMPIHISNVALFNPETQKADRIGFRIENDVKIRFFKSTNKAVDA
ncbi:50S ribosomal protein L24 [Thiomicrospira microaerophila]|uniref:50S ribosomal protein L24 n=1 Tax=Thiomicrospira microaerophila TaxID=406020 RepID=UPI00200E889C|nr:50S ribosomal protein L24 [Thiomicrospira microaerophila]UQB41999.1 50S ribosomal protein L24 [Thiomicrospira microaerophila]